MREGWICSRCRKSVAPHRDYCDCTDQVIPSLLPKIPSPWEWIPYSPWGTSADIPILPQFGPASNATDPSD